MSRLLEFRSAAQEIRDTSVGTAIVLLLASLAMMVLSGFAAVSHDVGLNGHVCFAISSLVAIVTVVCCRLYRTVTVGFFFVVLLVLFHGGIVLLQLFGLDVSGFNAADSLWLDLASLARPSAIAAFGVAAFATGYSSAFVLSTGWGKKHANYDECRCPTSSYSSVSTAVLGIVLLVVGVMGWYVVLLGSGLSPFGTTYVALLETATFPYMQYFYLAIGLGLVIVTASGRRGYGWAALVFFTTFAMPAFVMGLRGEVLIPIAATIVVASRRGFPVRVWHVFLGLAASLWVGSIIRVSRIEEGGISSSVSDASFWDGLVETGYSIRPLYEILNSPIVSAYPTGLATYWSPLRRIIVGRLGGIEVPPIDLDPAVYWTAVTKDIGPIGGSIIAEAFLSGRMWGVALVLLCVGILAAFLDSTRFEKSSDVIVGSVGLILFQWVRGDFTPIPLSLGIVAGVTLLSAGLARLKVNK